MDSQAVIKWFVKGSFVLTNPLGNYAFSKEIGMRTAEKNRLQNILEDANIKLASVVSDVFGVSGRAMLQAMANGQTDPNALASLAKGSLVKKERSP